MEGAFRLVAFRNRENIFQKNEVDSNDRTQKIGQKNEKTLDCQFMLLQHSATNEETSLNENVLLCLHKHASI